jgi:hypothetical protein
LAAVAAVRAETWTLELKRLGPEGRAEDNLYRAISPQSIRQIGDDEKGRMEFPGIEEQAAGFRRLVKNMEEQAAAFRRIIKKEPKYESKRPFRGVAKLGSQEYAFALDVVAPKPEAKEAKETKSATKTAETESESDSTSWIGSLLQVFSPSSSSSRKVVGYNRLYFDFNRNGDLTDDKLVEAEPSHGDSYFVCFQFPRVDVTLDLAGTKLDYSFLLSGYMSISEEPPDAEVEIKAAAYREGDITLEGKKHHVVVLDLNSNGRFDDEIAFPADRLDPIPGDVLLIDPSASNRDLYSLYYDWMSGEGRTMVAKLVKIDDRFYDLRISPAGDKLTLTPSSVSLGSVTNPNDGFHAMIYSVKCFLKISGNKDEPVPVPEGQWKLLSYTIDRTGYEKLSPSAEKKEEPKEKRTVVQALAATLGALLGGSDATQLRQPKPRHTIVSAQATAGYKPVTVRRGETVVMPFGPPYTPTVTADARGEDKKVLSLAILLVGSAGEECTDLRVEGGRPQQPAFTITDDKGKVVERGNFEYG